MIKIYFYFRHVLDAECTKAVALRGNLTEEALRAAIIAVKMIVYTFVRQLARPVLIPAKNNGNVDKEKQKMAYENRKKLATYVKSMQAKGFQLTVNGVRKLT